MKQVHWEQSDPGMKPKISIIIPVFNVEKYLRDCLESALNQSLKEIEIICVDDGSTDGSPAILEEYAARDARITVISQHNQGQSVARNTGVQYARGEYIQFLDSDDMLVLDSEEQLYAYAKAKNLDVVFFGATTVYENEQLKAELPAYESYYLSNNQYPPCGGPELFQKLRNDRAYREQPCLMMMRSSFLKAHAITLYPGIIHEDTLYNFQVILSAKRAAKIDKNFYIRRIRENSTMTVPKSFRNLYGYLKDYAQMLSFVETHRIDPKYEAEIIGYISAIKDGVARLSAEYLDKTTASQLSKTDRFWLDLIMAQADLKQVTAARRDMEQRAVRAEQELMTLREKKQQIEQELSSLRDREQRAAQELAATREREERTAQELSAAREREQRTAQELSAAREREQRTAQELTAAREREQRTAQELTAAREREQRTAQELTAALEREQRSAQELTAALEREQRTAQELTALREKEQRSAQELTAAREREQRTAQELTALREKEQRTAQELNDTRASWTYRIGRFCTFIPRKLRGGVRCCRENGMRYTWNRFLVHLRLKKE